MCITNLYFHSTQLLTQPSSGLRSSIGRQRIFFKRLGPRLGLPHCFVEVLHCLIPLKCSLPGVPLSTHYSAISRLPLQGLLQKSIIQHSEDVPNELHWLILISFGYVLLFRPSPQFLFTNHTIPSHLHYFSKTAAFKYPHTLYNFSQSFPGFAAVQQYRDHIVVKKFPLCAERQTIFILDSFHVPEGNSCRLR